MTAVAEYSKVFTRSKENIDPLNVLEGSLLNKEKDQAALEKILKGGFLVPTVRLEQNIGLAQTIVFVRDFWSSNIGEGAETLIKTEVRDNGIHVSYKDFEADDSDTIMLNTQYLFAFLHDALYNDYHPHASVSERLYKAAAKHIALHSNSKELREMLLASFKKFYLDVESHKYSEFGTIEFESFKESESHTKRAQLALSLLDGDNSWSYYKRYQKISNNLYLIDLKVFNKFLKSKGYKRFQAYKREDAPFNHEFTVLKEKAINALGSRLGYLYDSGSFTERVDYSDKDGQFLITQLLELANYSEDSSFLVDFYKKSFRRKKDLESIYTFAEIWSTNIDDYYSPKRNTKTLGEARSLNNSSIDGSSIVTAIKNVNPTTVIELLPAVGYKIESQKEEQIVYINLLIQTLAHKYKAIEAKDLARHTFSYYRAKAEAETKKTRSQNRETELIYGRAATQLFLNLDVEQISIVEAVDQNKIIENAKDLDNILIGLITGLAKF